MRLGAYTLNLTRTLVDASPTPPMTSALWHIACIAGHAARAHAALIMPVCRAYSNSPPASTTGPACSAWPTQVRHRRGVCSYKPKASANTCTWSVECRSEDHKQKIIPCPRRTPQCARITSSQAALFSTQDLPCAGQQLSKHCLKVSGRWGRTSPSGLSGNCLPVARSVRTSRSMSTSTSRPARLSRLGHPAA